MWGGSREEGAQLAATPREGHGMYPTTSKASSCPLVLTGSYLVKASLHVPPQSWSGKLKIRTPPTPKKEKGNHPERQEWGGSRERAWALPFSFGSWDQPLCL